MDRESYERNKRIMRIAAVTGILASIAGVVVGIIALVSMAMEKQRARNVEIERIFQEAESPADIGIGSLMVDTRSEKGKGAGGSLADLLADRQVYFAGIENATISQDTVIYLENMEENDDILMQYEITDKETDEVLETTGLIPAGEQVAWTPGEKLKAGTYTLIFHEKPFYPYDGDYAALTQGNNEVVFTIQ